MKAGKVFFVGAGPGDPKLITIRGLELLKKADVIIYDRLASPRLLLEAKPNAELIYCGKESNNHTLKQEEINRILIQRARNGNRVVRLKGGDPSMFGRVGEEAEACVSQHIPFEIIPGITSGIAAPAYAGIPLTHREYTGSVGFITGHRCAKNEGLDMDWSKVSGLETLVIYMGVKNLPVISKQLIKYGKSPTTPVALVRWGTTQKQETLVGDLTNIVEKVNQSGFASPAIIVIGEVVKLRTDLAWFENKSLFGKRVLLLERPYGHDDNRHLLEECGADVLSIPAYTHHLIQEKRLTELAQRINNLEWIVFENPMEVHFFFQFLKNQRVDIRQVHAKIAAVGKETEEALELKGVFPAHFEHEEICSIPDLLSHLDLKKGANILLLNQDGNGYYGSNECNGVHFTEASLYERSYTEMAPINRMLFEEEINLVILSAPEAAPFYTQTIHEPEMWIMDGSDKWTEEVIFSKMSQKVQSK